MATSVIRFNAKAKKDDKMSKVIQLFNHVVNMGAYKWVMGVALQCRHVLIVGIKPFK